MKRPRLSLIVIIISIVTGGWQFGQGLYIYAKAELAQYLLASAWQQTKQNKHAIKPWPWADMWPVARLEVPAHNVNLIVLAGDSGRTLAFGPGHRFGSAAPGDIGNSIISAHRDTHFEFLKHLAAGDEIVIENQLGSKTYFTVSGIQVVDSRDARIPIDYDNAALTLITCFPFDTLTTGGPLRYIVVAVKTTNAPAKHLV